MFLAGMHTLLLWAVWRRYRPVAKEEIHIILLTSETLTVSMQGWCVPDRCVPERKFLDVAPLEQNIPWILCPWPMCPDPGPHSVGRYCGLGRPPAPNESLGCLAGFAYAPDQVYWIGAPPSDARSAHTCRFAQSNQRDGMVRSGAK